MIYPALEWAIAAVANSSHNAYTQSKSPTGYSCFSPEILMAVMGKDQFCLRCLMKEERHTYVMRWCMLKACIQGRFVPPRGVPLLAVTWASLGPSIIRQYYVSGGSAGYAVFSITKEGFTLVLSAKRQGKTIPKFIRGGEGPSIAVSNRWLFFWYVNWLT